VVAVLDYIQGLCQRGSALIVQSAGLGNTTSHTRAVDSSERATRYEYFLVLFKGYQVC
jgi:hypothetical protein